MLIRLVSSLNLFDSSVHRKNLSRQDFHLLRVYVTVSFEYFHRDIRF